MPLDRNFQAENNGSLTRDARRRLLAVKSGLNLTLAQLGSELGFSGPFMSQLLRADEPTRIRSKHIPLLRQRLEELEMRAGLRSGSSAGPSSSRSDTVVTIEDLIRMAHRLGFEVSFKPLDRREP